MIDEQPLKASGGMTVMVEGRTTLSNEVQQQKQPCPRVESELGKRKECS